MMTCPNEPADRLYPMKYPLSNDEWSCFFCPLVDTLVSLSTLQGSTTMQFQIAVQRALLYWISPQVVRSCLSNVHAVTHCMPMLKFVIVALCAA